MSCMRSRTCRTLSTCALVNIPSMSVAQVLLMPGHVTDPAPMVQLPVSDPDRRQPELLAGGLDRRLEGVVAHGRAHFAGPEEPVIS